MKQSNIKFRILLAAVAITATLLFQSGCGSRPSITSSIPATTKAPTTSVTPATTIPPTGKTTTPPSTAKPASTKPADRTTPAIPVITPPPALIQSASKLDNTKYVVFAWNDLGMHCANPTYDKAVLLPPYNTVWAQVIKRGNPPQIVTSGLTVEYKILNNTSSYNKESYGQFWDNAQKLFGATLSKDTGLNLTDSNIHNGLSGTMAVKNDHFEADGIPLTPINDDGSWNPFQVGVITVKDSSGNIVAQTDATLPISDEINCIKCHGADAFQDILVKHDQRQGTNLTQQEPVLCASCHGDPALGNPSAGPNKFLSEAIHGFHATVSPQPACYDCHPGAVTQCSRSIAHTTADGNCITCHGDLAKVSSSISSGRVPWVSEPACVTCHPNVAEVNTQSTLYRNATGHGGVYCASCHSSPHAMTPSKIMSDNYQGLQYQGAAKTIGSCGACHDNSRGLRVSNDFIETHGGMNPEVDNACTICHTSVSADTSKWPHAFQWKATNGTGTARGD